MTLFGNKAFADVIKGLKAKPSWVLGALHPMAGVLLRSVSEDTERYPEETAV